MIQVTDVTENKVTLTDLQGKSIKISHDKLGSNKYTRFKENETYRLRLSQKAKPHLKHVTAPTTPMSQATNTAQAELKPVAINDKFQDKNGEELTVSGFTANRITLRTADK